MESREELVNQIEEARKRDMLDTDDEEECDHAR